MDDPNKVEQLDIPANPDEVLCPLPRRSENEQTILGRVEYLVRPLFRHENPGLQADAVKELMRLAEEGENQRRILQFPNVLEGLVEVLLTRVDHTVLHPAAWTLFHLSRASEYRVHLANFPGVLAGLLNVLTKDDFPNLQKLGLITLNNLAKDGRNKAAVLEFPSLLANLVELIYQDDIGGCTCVPELAVRVLSRLSEEPWGLQQTIATLPELERTIIYNLTKLLNVPDNCGSGLHEAAARAIGNLASGPEIQSRIGKHNQEAIFTLARLISDPESHDIRLNHRVACALGKLAEKPPNREAMTGAVGGLSTLLAVESDMFETGESGSWVVAQHAQYGAAKALTLINPATSDGMKLHSGKAFLGRGEALVILGRHMEAITDLNLAIRLDPKNGSSWRFRSLARRALKDYEEALLDADIAVSLMPRHVELWRERGLLKQLSGDLQGAVDDLHMASEMEHHGPTRDDGVREV